MKAERLIVIVTVLLSTISCSDEPFVRDYPEILSSEVFNVSADGVTFKATIGDKFREDIVEHGFVWSRNRDLRIDSDSTVYLGKPTSDTFTAGVTTPIEDGKEYYARAFLKTTKRVIYGIQMNFHR